MQLDSINAKKLNILSVLKNSQIAVINWENI